MGVVLLAVLLLGGCASEEGLDPNAPVPTVKAQLNFSLPSRIVSMNKTRMTDKIVQASQSPDDFRGLTDVQLLCFDEVPTVTSNKIGGMIDIKDNDLNDSIATENDYSLCQQIEVPVGTTHFEFYASAQEDYGEGEEAQYQSAHEKRMHFGALVTDGLSKDTYKGNASIRFRPLQICTSTALLGGSSAGNNLLNLLNSLMTITVNEPAPNDRWSTASNPFVNEAYQRMTQLTTLSSYNVQVMLGFILKMIHQTSADDPNGGDGQSDEIIEAITEVITERCARDDDNKPIVDIANGVIKLEEIYQGFPDDIHLPAGAARIKWDSEKNKFVVPDKQVYSDDLNVTSVNDYVYPVNLQYQVSSDIFASDDLVVLSTDEDGDVVEPDSPKYKTWSELITQGYDEDQKTVKPTTQSVAMARKVEYAVGHLVVRTKVSRDEVLDANGKSVITAATRDNPFTLKGYVVGSQRDVDYDFQPVPTSRTYAIYDTDLNGEAPHTVNQWGWTEEDHILGLGTPSDQTIMVALELVNNAQDFQGADGVIVKGATFYLVANVNPRDGGKNYRPGVLDQIFCKDIETKVSITIKSLKDATYGLPNLDIPRPTLGMSVDLRWEDGLWFPDVPL